PREWSAAFDGHRLDRDRLHRSIVHAGLCAADLLYDVHPVDHLAEHAVLVVEPRRGYQRDEELAAVSARSRVGHREDARLVVPPFRVEFVGEAVTGSARAGTERIAALDHEVLDHAVEDEAV